MAGRGTPATAMLAKLGVAHSVHVYDHDPRRGSFGLEASDALGVPPERVFLLPSKVEHDDKGKGSRADFSLR